uniref:Uncharacterized protein n=1 Tax=Rhizophora mucronata TaxID=61149 RepID=A0A2P2NJB7_RHIMU
MFCPQMHSQVMTPFRSIEGWYHLFTLSMSVPKGRKCLTSIL